ncbi:MAG: rhamnulokinase [Propionibacteriaceae bacterium]|jgi:rhamnulokinase|nr:rhamnulokinase [Propionibacteriaceae bacterium]
MMTNQRDILLAAADLGATSGRVMAGRLTEGRLTLDEVRRFPTSTLTKNEHLHWDVESLRNHIVAGFRQIAGAGELASVGVDTWGVDYGRLTRSGELIEEPFNYRDQRTAHVPAAFFAEHSAAGLYAEAGLQVMDFNTIFQYIASAEDPRWADVDSCLFLPDLFEYWLSGERHAELTIASTSGLLNVTRRDWSATTLAHLRERYHLDLASHLPAIVEPGTVVGVVRPSVLDSDAEVSVVAVGSHDTASAVAAIPASGRFGYISSGTWSLVGLELDHPILTEESRLADFTNELGVDGTVRYLRNVMGLWCLTESQRHWSATGRPTDLTTLLADAAALPALRAVVDMENPRLLPPGDMPARLAQLAAQSDQPAPTTPAEITRCVLDSLALDYRRVIRRAQRLAGVSIDAIHVVGGGCRNRLLNQLTADATGLPVVAGPAEATAMGNLLVQAQAIGALPQGMAALRQVSRESCELTTFLPGGLGLSEEDWRRAERRLWPTDV